MLLRLLVWGVAHLPAFIGQALGRSLAWIAWILGIRRQVACSNIEKALGFAPARARRLARAVYRNLGDTAAEFMRVDHLTPDRAQGLLGADNLASIRSVLAEGRGVLVLTAHLGNWDLLACAAAAAGLKVSVVTRRLKNRPIDRVWMDARRRCGVRLLPERGSAAAVLAALRRNEVVAFVLDQHDPDGVHVRFFGRPAATSASLARLARATGAPVVPAVLLRRGRRFETRLLPPIRARREESRSADVLARTQTYTSILEQLIRDAPDQWLWLHRRWKVGFFRH